MAALWVQDQSGGSSRIVLIGRPKRWAERFALIVAPSQFKIPPRANLVQLILPLLRADPAAVAAAGTAWKTRLAPLARPLTAVLIGGATKPFRFDASVAATLLAELRACRPVTAAPSTSAPAAGPNPRSSTALEKGCRPKPAALSLVGRDQGRQPVPGVAGAGRSVRRHRRQRVDDGGGGESGPTAGDLLAAPRQEPGRSLAVGDRWPEAARLGHTPAASARHRWLRARSGRDPAGIDRARVGSAAWPVLPHDRFTTRRRARSCGAAHPRSACLDAAPLENLTVLVTYGSSTPSTNQRSQRGSMMLYYLWKRVSREVILFFAFFLPPERKRQLERRLRGKEEFRKLEPGRRRDRLVRQERPDLVAGAAVTLLPASVRAAALGVHRLRQPAPRRTPASRGVLHARQLSA